MRDLVWEINDFMFDVLDSFFKKKLAYRKSSFDFKKKAGLVTSISVGIKWYIYLYLSK